MHLIHPFNRPIVASVDRNRPVQTPEGRQHGYQVRLRTLAVSIGDAKQTHFSNAGTACKVLGASIGRSRDRGIDRRPNSIEAAYVGLDRACFWAPHLDFFQKYPNRSVCVAGGKCSCKKQQNMITLSTPCPHRPAPGKAKMVLTQRRRSNDDTILPSASDDYDPKGPFFGGA